MLTITQCLLSTAFIGLLWADTADGQQIIRLTVRPDGAEAQGASGAAGLSLDGRFVVFTSDAPDLASIDQNGVRDVFVHDRRYHASDLVSRHTSGVQALSESVLPAISGDGRFVTFSSRAAELTDGDTNGAADVFLRDRKLRTTTRISVASDGTQANGDSTESWISEDGQVIAFLSRANSLVLGDTNGVADVFVHFPATGETRRVSVSSTGVQANSHSGAPRVSSDGRFVTFWTYASNLIDGTPTTMQQTMLHDLATGTTELVSVASDGTPGQDRSGIGHPSATGRYVAFESRAGNLVPQDTNPDWDVFVRDRLTGITEKVSIASTGAQVLGLSHRPMTDPTGRFVVFRSDAADLAAGDGPDADVFFHDRRTGETRLVPHGLGGSAPNGTSHAAGIAADGRTVAFSSEATNLVPGDLAGFEDVFVQILPPTSVASRHTSLASISSEALTATATSDGSALSRDGRVVAFHSAAPDLVFYDTNDHSDIFVHEPETALTTRVSLATNGAQANGSSERPEVSGDGRFVVFQSRAMNLDLRVFDGNGDSFDIFVHDRSSGVTDCVSVDQDGIAGFGVSLRASISDDGRYVAFESTQARMVMNDTNNRTDVFVRDRLLGVNYMASVSSAGVQGNLHSTAPRISGNGRFVAFRSTADNLVPDDTNGVEDVFVHDMATGTTSRVSVDSLGEQGNARSSEVDISDDGRYVVFESEAGNLVENDQNRTWDVFVHDRQSGITVRASVDSYGSGGNGVSHRPRISPDGRYVLFRSSAGNLVPGDDNLAFDVFLHDLHTGRTTRVSVSGDGDQADADSEAGALSADATLIAFPSDATNLVLHDVNGVRDVFIHARCDVTFEPFGTGLSGSAGLIPHLSGRAGACDDYRLRAWNGLGGAPGVLAVSPVESAWPLLGGTLYFDVLQPYVSFPLVLGGPAGIPGAGGFDLLIPGVGGLSGQTWILQTVILDGSAPQGVSLTNGLRMRIND